MEDLTAYCPECDTMVLIVPRETCCMVDWVCSECGRIIKWDERREESES